jgi:hypothetical protein
VKEIFDNTISYALICFLDFEWNDKGSDLHTTALRPKGVKRTLFYIFRETQKTTLKERFHHCWYRCCNVGDLILLAILKQKTSQMLTFSVFHFL